MRTHKEIPDDFVAMAIHICPVCGVQHSHNTEILLHKQFRSIPEDKRVTGMSLCEEHEQLDNDGFIALIESIPTYEVPNGAMVKSQDLRRTGRVIHIKRASALNIINGMSEEVINDTPLVHIDVDSFQTIMEVYASFQNDSPTVH